MDHVSIRGCSSSSENTQGEEDMELRRGPWTVEEDLILINYITNHGEGRWNSLARCAGLKRNGKSCRLRWLNYLRPDVRRGNITPEEQLLILELHSRWGNRWSKIAQHLPGRTDNEIKNYWRTRVQKHAKQLQCDVNSKKFKDTMRYLWMPRLVERIQAAGNTVTHNLNNNINTTNNTNTNTNIDFTGNPVLPMPTVSSNDYYGSQVSMDASPDSLGTQVSMGSDLKDQCYNYQVDYNNQIDNTQITHHDYSKSLTSPSGFFNPGEQFQGGDQTMWLGGEDVPQFNIEDLWFIEQHLFSGV
ncbi:hypothetical protein GIB67_024033 [Kingdonia uniflora]|uniref:Uncharacterized protein n=1 Tax=Kingdonia uniflora TaxID=39325 RepID=A0A7J7LAR0_9MAGN|nr:hypothetical protein GIB67_024033 [Kingdonia uniflora]